MRTRLETSRKRSKTLENARKRSKTLENARKRARTLENAREGSKTLEIFSTYSEASRLTFEGLDVPKMSLSGLKHLLCILGDF